MSASSPLIGVAALGNSDLLTPGTTLERSIEDGGFVVWSSLVDSALSSAVMVAEPDEAGLSGE